MQRFEIIRGDTFTAHATYTDGDGNPVDLTGYSIDCEMVRDDTRFSFNTAVTNAVAGAFSLSATAEQTAALEIGTYKSDIEYRLGDVVSSSDVFRVIVREDVTNAN